MNRWNNWPCAVLIAATLTSVVSGQVPGTIPGAVPGAGVVGTAPVTAAPSTGMTLWQFLGCTPEAKARCKECLCRTPLGQMLNNMITGPMGAMTGGMIPPLCPTVPTNKQLQDLANDPKKKGGAEDVAAKIKAEEAEAKAKIAAIKYLATVDCERYPDARKALIASLRADPNYCVRLAAAVALGTGCCCHKETINALRICASGSDEDGQPVEKCDAVRQAAAYALERCVACYREPVKSNEKPPEGPRTGEGPVGFTKRVDPAVYEKNLANKPLSEVVSQAKASLAANQPVNTTNSTNSTHVNQPRSERSLLGIMRGSVNKDSTETMVVTGNQAGGMNATIVFDDSTRLTPIPTQSTSSVQQTVVTVPQQGTTSMIIVPSEPEKPTVQKKLFQFLNGKDKK